MKGHTKTARRSWVGREEIGLALAFRQMLERLCEATQVPPADRAVVIDSATLVLAGTPLAFQLEEWSGFVKVYIDLGKPDAESAPMLYRHLLEEQMYLTAPFAMVPALHPESGHIVLLACAPLPADRVADTDFHAFLGACTQAAETLKANRMATAEAAEKRGRAGHRFDVSTRIQPTASFPIPM